MQLHVRTAALLPSIVVLAGACRPPPPRAHPPPDPSRAAPPPRSEPEREVAGDPARAVRATCRWESANPVTDATYTFHGSVPWRGISDPRGSECCALPEATLACVVDAYEGHGVPTSDGVTAIQLSLTHVRLFEVGTASPWLDVVISGREARPMVPRMDDPPAAPLFEGHVEVDAAGVRIVTTDPDPCAPLPCERTGSLDCGAYREMVASWRAALCAARGDYAWKGRRLERSNAGSRQ